MHSTPFFTAIIAALSLCLGLAAGAAQATVISGTPGASFEGGSYTLTLASGAARYTFSDTGSTGESPVGIQTGGDAGVYSAPFSGGDPSSYIAGTGGFTIDQGFAAGTFETFPNPTPVPFSRGDTFYVLGLDLSDGLHYGYARTDNQTLQSFGYQSVAGRAIHTGAQSGPARVPEPPSLAVLGLGLLLLGFGLVGRRQFRRNQRVFWTKKYVT